MCEANQKAIKLLSELIDKLPKCSICKKKPATKAWMRGGDRFCDGCGAKDCPDYPRAQAVRESISFLLNNH